MRVLIINTSERIGGAAIAASRLMESLKNNGIKAKMLVRDKQTDQISVVRLKSNWLQVWKFMWERIVIWSANRFRRYHLFDVDIANTGTDITSLPEFRQADVIHLHWVNQGMLSLNDIRKILASGKPVVWTMHDMWNFTGICHHAGDCTRWRQNCGLCRFLGKMATPVDLSFKVLNNKRKVYGGRGTLHFVAVSNWLADLARQSTLLGEQAVSVIPNAFPIPDDAEHLREGHARTHEHKFRVVMGAARLDDPVKGLPILVEATRILRDDYGDEAEGIELVTFGNLRDPQALDGVGISHTHLGVIAGEENVRDVYLGADAVVSTSLYETLPGTLVEGQVYGCIPVSFGRGGQSDIVSHGETGYTADWDDDMHVAACNIAEGILWAKRQDAANMEARMLASARAKFAAPVVAGEYIALFERLLQ